MVELQHGKPTPALYHYLLLNPRGQVADFDSKLFAPIKKRVKADLHAQQQGLCVYCERKLDADQGQVEHIKPKDPNQFPELCFSFTNYAHSCINDKTCGQKKGNKLLPIEPAPGCNAQWTLSTTGSIEPIADLTKKQRHLIVSTRDMLGLNKDATLVVDRQRYVQQVLEIMQQYSPEAAKVFIQDKPYRYMLATLL